MELQVAKLYREHSHTYRYSERPLVRHCGAAGGVLEGAGLSREPHYIPELRQHTRAGNSVYGSGGDAKACDRMVAGQRQNIQVEDQGPVLQHQQY